MTSRDLAYLEDMRIHARDALAITRNLGRDAFLKSRPMQHAVIRCLTVIGEAANRVSKETYAELRPSHWRSHRPALHDYRRIPGESS